MCTLFWLGSIHSRFIVGNRLLNYDEFNFRTSIPPDEENQIFQTITDLSIAIMIFYPLTFLFAVLFLKNSHIDLKRNGWLFMSALLFFVFSPVEFYTSYIDYKFIMLFYRKPANHDVLLELFGKRIGFLKGVPWIAVFSYYTIIFLSIFRPLNITEKDIEERKKLEIETSYKYMLHEDDDLYDSSNEREII
jgi:hypothetical protein